MPGNCSNRSTQQGPFRSVSALLSSHLCPCSATLSPVGVRLVVLASVTHMPPVMPQPLLWFSTLAGCRVLLWAGLDHISPRPWFSLCSQCIRQSESVLPLHMFGNRATNDPSAREGRAGCHRAWCPLAWGPCRRPVRPGLPHPGIPLFVSASQYCRIWSIQTSRPEPTVKSASA